ncbi:hypothetical protein Dsin_024706 [Dipteronia sinensis]|uniref:DDE Tnp4 domain-containing protein n=1 Tax=Dipteronia sinensis TaxID=43782 RepID=A0AAE0DWG9_9ROSI|nr:hypothetical protein Dsin_024706 [Dipteronia sinensis]
MDRNAFAMLRDLIKTRGGLLDDGNIIIDEQVASFVNILAHHNKNRNSQEGSATDSRVPQDAITRHNGMKVPFGYTNGQCFLAPYRGTRYHLQEWADFDRAPGNHEEYFNMKHSQTRNIIGRCFGLLKKRWAILRSPSFYPIRFQGRMIIACTLLHNFIRMYMDVNPEEYTPVTLDDFPIGEDVPNEVESIDIVEGSDE